MRINIQERRLKKIKDRFVFWGTRCECCGEVVKFEKMWRVWRDGVNHTNHLWSYCKHCMPTAKAVLHEIDTDGCIFGIAGIDERRRFKKDTTRIYARRFESPNGN